MKKSGRPVFLRSLTWAVVIFPAVFLEAALLYSQKVPLIWFFSSYENFFMAGLLQGLIIFACVKLVDISQVVSFLVFLLLASFSTLSIVHCLVFNSVVSLGAIASFLESNLQEGSEFLLIVPSWIYVVAACYFVLCLILFMITKPASGRRLVGFCFHATVFLVCVVLLFYTSLGFKSKALNQGFIWKALNISFNASPHLRPVSGYKFYREEKQKIAGYKSTIGDTPFLIASVNDLPATVVLVVGESMRRDRLGIYDYPLDTTPFLSSIRDELLIFKNAISPAPLTYYSVPRFLTTQSVQKGDSFEQSPSVVHLAKQAGYKTFWISNQAVIGGPEGPAAAIASIADNHAFTNTDGNSSSLDGRVVEHVNVAIDDPSKKKFIVIHLIGSHPAFHRRYPTSFEYFTADMYSNKQMDEQSKSVNAHYDNSILYTDSLLKEIITSLDEKAPNYASLIFLADHGMILPQSSNDFYGHGNSDDMHDVPFFIWMKGREVDISDRQKNANYLTENLIHSLSNILNVRYKRYDQSLDILHEGYQQPSLKILDNNKKTRVYAR